MRAFIIILMLILFTNNILYGQKEGNIWYFGDHAGISFNTSPPTILTDNKFDLWNTGIEINTRCDAGGNLRFIATGDTIRDKNWNIMPNGQGAKYGIFSPVIVPFPGDTNKYYVFTQSDAENSYKQYYSIIDMTLNGGLGAVIKDSVILCDSIEMGTMATTIHANKRDIWFVNHEVGERNFHAYLITASGIAPAVISNVGYKYGNLEASEYGKVRFNSAGNVIGVYEHINVNFTGYTVHLYSFNNNTGKISNFLHIVDKYQSTNGFEFSPDNSKLYVSYYDSLVQYDLSLKDSTSILQSRTRIAKDIQNVGEPMLGPDGHIYIAQVNKPYLNVIENPNAPASKVIYKYRGIDLLGRNAELLLPLQTVYGLIPEANFMYQYNCFGDSVFFNGNSTRKPAQFSWDFGDTASHTRDTSSKQNPVHYYARPGTYTVKLVADVNGFKDTATQTVTVKVSAFSLGPDTTLCAGQSYPLSAAMPSVRYLWSTGDTTASVQAKSTGTYWVKAYTSTCARYDTVKLKFVDVKTDLGKDTSICRDGSIRLDAGIDSVSYLWSDGETTRAIQVTKAGTYKVTVKRAACTASDSITVMQAPEPSKVIPGYLYLCPDWKETQSVDAGIAKSYLWQPGGYRGQVFTAQDTGQYTLVTANGYGCTRTDTFHVIRQCPPSLQVPNAFTPNRDSLNQTFIPVGLDIENFEMYVYDRWGEMIYYTTSFNKGWDGTFKGNSCPEGLYFYKLKCTGYGRPEKTIIRKTGTLYLIR